MGMYHDASVIMTREFRFITLIKSICQMETATILCEMRQQQ